MTEIEDRWRDLGAFIREQRRVGQLSLRKLSEMAGISNPYLSQIERGLRKPSAEILRNIAGALSISAETLYVRAGILDERDGDHDLVADIWRDPSIDEEQKKTLVHIYLSFRSAHLAGAGAPTAPVAATLEAGLPALGAGLEPDDLDLDRPEPEPGPEPEPEPEPEPGSESDAAPDGDDRGSEGDGDPPAPDDEADPTP